MRKILLAAVATMWPIVALSVTHNFDELKSGATMKGWDQGFYGSKGSPVWTIDTDPTAPSKPNALKQTGKATYAWFVQNDLEFTDGVVESDMKVSSGKEDPEVGLVWRHKDGKNYYYVRINAAEDNIVFYRMNKGKKELVKEADTKVGFDKWHHLKVQFKGEQIDVLYDEKPLISVRDSVFKNPGHAGLFTTADTVGAFDNVTFSPNK
jgi:hypothetical protein